MNSGKEFEKLIAFIEQVVHDLPGAKVTHDIKMSTKAGVERQVDILITEDRGRFLYKTIIECKDTKSKVTLNTVGAFKELIESVGAHQGIIVSSAGFQSGAIQLAKQHNIFIFQLAAINALSKHLHEQRFNYYKIEHKSKEVVIRFEEKVEINKYVDLHVELFSPYKNLKTSIVDVDQNFLTTRKSTIADSMVRKITNPTQPQIVYASTEFTINFITPLIFVKDSSFTKITGFDAIIETKLFTAPSELANVSEYKNVITNETYAYVYELEYEGHKQKCVEKDNALMFHQFMKK